MKRHELVPLRDLIKTSSGTTARHALLAYALLRELPYRRCEPVTDYDRAELPEHARDFVRRKLAHGIAEESGGRVDKAAALAWLLEPETPAAHLARVERERAAVALVTARRAAFRERVLAQRAGAA